MKLLSFVDNNFYHSQLAEFRVMQELCAQRWYKKYSPGNIS
jgi:hypothetical protein